MLSHIETNTTHPTTKDLNEPVPMADPITRIVDGRAGHQELLDQDERQLVDATLARIEQGAHPAEIIRKAYFTSRRLGDGELIKDTDERFKKSRNILWSSYASARPESFLPFTDNDDHIGQHGEYNRSLAIRADSTLSPEAATKFFADRGVKISNSSHAQLLLVLNVAAHEAGHAVLSGISRMFTDDYHERGALFATASFLRNHPEKAFTGHWYTDVAVHEERFAEGYEKLATQRLLEVLGYGHRPSKKILKALAPNLDVQGKKGGNQIDHLKKVSHEKGPADFVEEGSDRQSNNSGNFGYAFPLSRQEMLEQLNDTADLISRSPGNYDFAQPDNKKWFQRAKKNRTARHAARLLNMRNRRWEQLNPNKSVAAYLIGGLAVTVPTAMVVSDELFPYDHDRGAVAPQVVKAAKPQAAPSKSIKREHLTPYIKRAHTKKP